MLDDPVTAATTARRTPTRESMVPHFRTHPVVLQPARRCEVLRKQPMLVPALSGPPPRAHSAAKISFRAALWTLCAAVAAPLWRPFTIARIAGVPVQMHPATLLYPGAFVLWWGWHDAGARGLWAMVTLLGMVWLSLLVHEFAHILTARRCGIGTGRMVFLPVGAVALLDEIPSHTRELRIALAGPIASLALAGSCALMLWAMRHGLHAPLHQIFPTSPWLFTVARGLRLGTEINLCLAFFNLLPCYPMDGGRVVRALLTMGLEKFMRRSRGTALLLATRITVRWIAWPLALGAAALTITRTHLWAHLLLFPLLLVAAEFEYWLVRWAEPEPAQNRELGPRLGA